LISIGSNAIKLSRVIPSSKGADVDDLVGRRFFGRDILLHTFLKLISHIIPVLKIIDQVFGQLLRLSFSASGTVLWVEAEPNRGSMTDESDPDICSLAQERKLLTIGLLILLNPRML